MIFFLKMYSANMVNHCDRFSNIKPIFDCWNNPARSLRIFLWFLLCLLLELFANSLYRIFTPMLLNDTGL